MRKIAVRYSGALLLGVLFLGSCSTSKPADEPREGACYTSNHTRCYRDAQVWEQGNIRARRRALTTMQYLCLQDHLPACQRLKEYYSFQNESARLPRSQVLEHRDWCEEGELDSCMIYAEYAPSQRAMEVYRLACEAEVGRGCRKLGEHVKLRFRLDHSAPQEALDLFARACELGDAQGCSLAGQSYLFGSGVEADRAQAFEYFDRGCNEETGDGCPLVVSIFREGIGTEQDLERAATYEAAAVIAGESRLVHSLEAAWLIFVDSCNHGFLPGCYNAGHFAQEGRVVMRNMSTALSFFQRACSEGLSPACSRAEAIDGP